MLNEYKGYKDLWRKVGVWGSDDNGEPITDANERH